MGKKSGMARRNSLFDILLAKAVKLFTLLAVMLSGVVVVCAQSPKTNELQERQLRSGDRRVIVAQTQADAQAVLGTAQKTGSKIVGIIEFPQVMLPEVIDHRYGSGEIVAVYFRSLTNQWTGVSYSAKTTPIEGFAQAVERFSKSHRRANPNDDQSLFGIEAFAVRTTAESLEQWLKLFPNAQLVYARELSPEGLKQFHERRAAGLLDVYIPHRSSAGDKSNGLLKQSQSNIEASSSGSFLPTSANLTIDAPSSNQRMISGSFSWSTDDALAGLKAPLATLEIQTLFWKYAPTSEAKSTYVGDPIDSGADWSSSYYDVNFLDDAGFQGSELKQSYTLGAADASRAFRSNTTYNFWISTKPGDLSASLVEFSAQKGTYIPIPPPLPDVCAINPSWCVYPIGETDWFSPSVPYGTGARQFSIVAPTVFPFKYPTPICETQPGQPDLSTDLVNLSRSDGVRLGNQMAAIQKAFNDGGRKPIVGCATTRLHEDFAWWPRGGKTQDFDGGQAGNGALLLAPDGAQAFWIHGGIWTHYKSIGGPTSVVGEPTGNEDAVTSSRGTKGAYQAFTRGYLYYSGPKNQTFTVANAIADKYRSVGLHSDPLGFPISNEYASNGGARNDFEGGFIQWTPTAGAVITRNQSGEPTLGGYQWSPTPVAGQPFGGTVTGTGFVVGATELVFCIADTSTCYQQPPPLVTINNANSLSVTGVNLSAGPWQIFVRTTAGPSARAAAFNVGTTQSNAPTISNYQWSPTPVAGQPFGGTVTGTGFVPGATELVFCIANTSTCYQQPPPLVTVNNTSTLSVTGVNLSAGPWQIFVRTAAGPSARAAAFTVGTTQSSAPTISNYQWSPTPAAGQPFGGTVTGTGFVPGATELVFCIANTSTCYQQPPPLVTVNNTTTLSVTGVNLSAGPWQIFVKTAAGPSARAAAFTVGTTQSSAPTISNYQWSPTPVAGQPFGGTVTGTGFVPGATELVFCIANTNTCYQQPPPLVTVNNTTTLSVTAVNLSAGPWQIFVRTAAGPSARAAAFTVGTTQSSAPTISNYQWSPTPVAGQPFGGTVTGTGFVPGATELVFCIANTSTCYQQPPPLVTVNNTTTLRFTGGD